MSTPNAPQISTAASFKKAAQGEPLELPSGNTVLVTRPGLDKLLVMNVIPDSLMPLAQKAVEKGKGSKPKGTSDTDLAELMQDQSKVQEVFRSFDRVAAEVVKQPEVRWHMRPATPLGDGHAMALAAGEAKAEFEEIPSSERDPDVVYTDEVDFTDKMFIFQFVVGGTRDLETFRRELGESLDGVQPGTEPEQQA